MKTYRPSYMPAIVIAVLGTGSILSVVFNPRFPIRQANLHSQIFISCAALFYAALTLGILFGIRITVDNKRLRNIAPFQWKEWRECNIADIKSISRCGTFNILASVYKSVCVEYHTDRGEKIMKINLNLYPETTVKVLIDDLKVVNPHIQVHGF
jgi:hypothetical protein